MIPAARTPKNANDPQRLLVIDPAQGGFSDATLTDLARLLRAPDLLVLNDSASLPAALRFQFGSEPGSCELRLAVRTADDSWWAVVFGAGDHTQPTEARGTAPHVEVGNTLELAPNLHARVLEVNPEHPRLVRLAFTEHGAQFWQGLYAAAKPVQYSYLKAELSLWDVQTRFASAPWSVEMPSAGRPVSFALLSSLRRCGVRWVSLRHAAGLSSTGDARLDQLLPLPERYQLDETGVLAVQRCRAEGGRVIAVGTSVVRALESNVREFGALRAAQGTAELKISKATQLQIVDGILSGLHEPGSSHFALLEAFAPAGLLEASARHAGLNGYTQHEFGDSCLVLRGALSSRSSLVRVA